jgi:hypothetical protein
VRRPSHASPPSATRTSSEIARSGSIATRREGQENESARGVEANNDNRRTRGSWFETRACGSLLTTRLGVRRRPFRSLIPRRPATQASLQPLPEERGHEASRLEGRGWPVRYPLVEPPRVAAHCSRREPAARSSPRGWGCGGLGRCQGMPACGKYDSWS